jgi:ligand-binding sensor domain-containing protein
VSGYQVWNVYEDKTGDIWFTAMGVGVYRYDGKSFTQFDKKDGLACMSSNKVDILLPEVKSQILV